WRGHGPCLGGGAAGLWYGQPGGVLDACIAQPHTVVCACAVWHTVIACRAAGQFVCTPWQWRRTISGAFDAAGGLGAVALSRGHHDAGDSAGQHACQTDRSEEHTSELQSRENLVYRLLLEK